MCRSARIASAGFKEFIMDRDSEILGNGPRILPLDRVEAAEQARAATNRLRGDIVGDSAPLPLEAIPEIMFTLCRWPDLWDRYMALAIQTQGPAAMLSPRHRQLAILRTAWLLQAPYEWGEHVKHSKHFGISIEEIERVIAGPDAPEWEPLEGAIVRTADELRETVMVCDATWAALGTGLDDGQKFELLVLIGQFTATAYFQNALRLRLEPGNIGMAAR
jgi:4-carboxymuconolactone decarboxylase